MNTGELKLDIKRLIGEYRIAVEKEIKEWMMNTPEGERIEKLTDFINKNDEQPKGIRSPLNQINRQVAHQALRRILK